MPESRGRQNRHIRSEKKIIMLKEKKENNKKPEIYSLSTGDPCICDFRIHDPPLFLDLVSIINFGKWNFEKFWTHFEVLY